MSAATASGNANSSNTSSGHGALTSHATRADNHSSASAASGVPLMPGRPVQVCTAVSRKPAIIARPKPNSSSCRCQPSHPPAGCQSAIEPLKAASHSGMASMANRQPARKNGRKANRNNGAMAIAFRRSSTCIKTSPLPCCPPGADLRAPRSIRLQSSGIADLLQLSQIKCARAVPSLRPLPGLAH
ncbi:hypothetical protein PS685_05246 [Pseudomonas fluorescens]|uniref:Uncharacterized protein n=1 Tax=Pseudomonas fluorescens TaxID=294 RepID=A0A5E7A7A2_PSEFL|nr:hypothetical protein PS685_05246 [Pseudomonas fluorescens]